MEHELEGPFPSDRGHDVGSEAPPRGGYRQPASLRLSSDNGLMIRARPLLVAREENHPHALGHGCDDRKILGLLALNKHGVAVARLAPLTLPGKAKG
jgi:hypothetical protein